MRCVCVSFMLVLLVDTDKTKSRKKIKCFLLLAGLCVFFSCFLVPHFREAYNLTERAKNTKINVYK